jgi:hypothetical integral membrane protein (TIGR02206 family)
VPADGFRAFGSAHLFALGAVTCLAAALFSFARRPPPPSLDSAFRRAFAAVLVLALLAEQVALVATGRFDPAWSLPLELCDVASVACAVALWTRAAPAFELAYYWAFSGSALALLTPDLRDPFPHPEFVRFFFHHGATVAGAAYLLAGQRPRPGSWLRAYAWTAIYAAVAGLFDLAIGANYFYLRSKPEGFTPLDWLGPWPWYVGGGAGAAALLFWALGRVSRS